MPTRRAFLVLTTAAALLRCERADPAPRCAVCGMRFDPTSRWRAGGRSAQGNPLVFDTPACLFRYSRTQHRGEVLEPWVREYYGGPDAPAADARLQRFAQGSDLAGPMGADLVPVSPARAEGFARDHHARRVLGYDEVTAEVLGAL